MGDQDIAREGPARKEGWINAINPTFNDWAGTQQQSMELCEDLEACMKKFHILLPSLNVGIEFIHGFLAKIDFSRPEIAERKRRGREQENSHECVIQTQIKFL